MPADSVSGESPLPSLPSLQFACLFAVSSAKKENLSQIACSEYTNSIYECSPAMAQLPAMRALRIKASSDNFWGDTHIWSIAVAHFPPHFFRVD